MGRQWPAAGSGALCLFLIQQLSDPFLFFLLLIFILLVIFLIFTNVFYYLLNLTVFFLGHLIII